MDGQTLRVRGKELLGHGGGVVPGAILDQDQGLRGRGQHGRQEGAVALRRKTLGLPLIGQASRSSRRTAQILFILTLTVYSYFVANPGWNQTSRMALIMSIVNHHQLSIDPYQAITGDKALFKGHYYSTKAPGTALLGVPVYAAFRQLQHLERYPKLSEDVRYPLYLVTVVVVALPSAVLSVLFFSFLLRLSGKRSWALTLTLLYSFGALLLGYNWLTLGSPLRFAYLYVSNPYFGPMRSGFFGIARPHWSSFVAITVGPQGILTQSAFLWLLPLGIWQMSPIARWRWELLLCLALGVSYVLWNSGYYMPLGGESPGARYLVDIIPFLIVPLAFLPTLPRRYFTLVRPLFLLMGLWSVGLYFLISVTNPLISIVTNDPIAQYWLPLFRHERFLINVASLRFGLWGWQSLVPLALVAVIAMGAFIFTERGPVHRNMLMHLSGVSLLIFAYLLVGLPVNLVHPEAVPSLFAK